VSIETITGAVEHRVRGRFVSQILGVVERPGRRGVLPARRRAELASAASGPQNAR